MNDKILLYNGSFSVVEFPEIRLARFNKDFYFGFYCTIFLSQAKRWATRINHIGFINEYYYSPDITLNKLTFDKMDEEWLDFIIQCRLGNPHNYDIVEGPMADDTIYNYVQNYIDGKISRAAFWELAKFKKPTNQISFHTAKALAALEFVRGYEITNEE